MNFYVKVFHHNGHQYGYLAFDQDCVGLDGLRVADDELALFNSADKAERAARVFQQDNPNLVCTVSALP